ncbi:2Fe-2S iron-sulfur cluster-binding protein [Streptomyces sp. enrichment culture]|uniref:2Fe-2S iron-sulfur cluster-binding protein n=1 Tax=Streptomyces sp. enrichment culture TaxID=1795815 RepID=UPI003F54B9B6
MTDDQHGDEYVDQHDARHDDRHPGGTPSGGGRWDPLPQGDYDDGATAFVKLPEGGVDALLASSESPLAAPGHGYVPPQITVAPATTAGTDPAATGSWTMPSAPTAPVDGAQWQVPDAGQDPAAHQGYGDYAAQQDPYGGAAPYGADAGQDDRFGYPPGATGHWDFSQAAQAPHAETEAAAARPAPGQDVTGQWSIPVADGDLPDESGEFTTSSLAEQWGTGAPATLPGGAPAPWATQPTGRPWGEPTGPADEERPTGTAHGPVPAGTGHDYGTGADPHVPHPSGPASAHGQDVEHGSPARGHGPESGAGAGPGRTDPAAGPHGPDTAAAYGSAPAASGPGYGADADHGTDATVGGHGTNATVVGPGTDSALGGHDSDSTLGGHGPDSALGGHGAEAVHGSARGPESGAGAGHGPGSGSGGAGQEPNSPAPAADASAHRPGAVGNPDGPGPADGPYGQAPAADVPPVTEAAAGPAAPGGDASPGAEEAPEGPAGRSPGTAGEDSAGSRPQDAEGPVAGPAPADGREHAAEPAREPGQEPAAEPRPESAADPRGVPAGHAAEAADAADTADAAADARATEAAPDGAEEPPAPAGPQEEHPLASYVLRVNGADRPVTDAWIGESLLYVLRERLGLAGAKDGCSQGECGACNVQVDGRLVASCLVPAVTSAGSEVRTVEGLATDGQPSDVQRALARRGAVQCGFCVPGMAMTVHNLLEGNPAPTELEARQALCGNLCRCSGYRGVLEAVQEVVAEREAHADADAQAGADSEEPRIPHQAGPGAGGVNPAAFDSQPPPGAPDTTGQHDHPPYGDHGDHSRDGGHA